MNRRTLIGSVLALLGLGKLAKPAPAEPMSRSAIMRDVASDGSIDYEDFVEMVDEAYARMLVGEVNPTAVQWWEGLEVDPDGYIRPFKDMRPWDGGRR